MYLTRDYKGIQVFDRDAAVAFLRETKGDKCAFPGCTHEWSTEPTSPWHMTLDHSTPQSKMKADKKPHAEIWDTDNLDLMHRVCNQRKGDVEYNDDGSLTLVEIVRTVKIARPDICETCNAGRAVGKGDTCPDCGSGPQPTTWPAYMQMDPRECAHDRVSHCKFCVPGFTERIEPLDLS